MYLVLILTAFLPLTHGLIGYDCGGSALNITTVSLLDVDQCKIPDTKINNSTVTIRLLQNSEFGNVEINQCKIEVKRVAQYCGMHSHLSSVEGGRREFFLDFDYRKCLEFQQTGNIVLFNNILVTGIKRNSTNFKTFTIAGKNTINGNCQGSTYSDPYGQWDNVVVEVNLKIHLRNSNVPYNFKSNKIILPSGTRCDLNDGECRDSDGYSTFWDIVQSNNCEFKEYSVLYEGKATKIEMEEQPAVYTFVSEDITFAMAQVGHTVICGYNIIKLEHPKLVIMPVDSAAEFPKGTVLTVNNMDLFTYMNSKFVYIERHVNSQFNDLYRDVLLHRCEAERATLTNVLGFSTLTPDEFGYILMKEAGYYAVVAGELVHIIKCEAVKVQVRQTEKCYQELAVTYKNQSYFVSAKSKTLVKRGTELPCDHLLPVGYKIDGYWYHTTPKLLISPPPGQLKPQTKPTWSYKKAEHLATSGIYSQMDLDKLRDRIMFPAEKPAVLNSIAQGVTGHGAGKDGISLLNLMDEKTLEHVASDTAKRMWSGFVEFGSASAGVMAILLIFKLFKMLIDTCINGYALHEAYGCGLYLIGALWNTLASFLLHRTREPTRSNAQDMEMGNIPIPRVRTSRMEPKDEDSQSVNLEGVETSLLRKLRQSCRSFRHN